jgi:hypothetical protein
MEVNQTVSGVAARPRRLSYFSEAVVPTEYGRVQVTVFREERPLSEHAPFNEHMALVVDTGMTMNYLRANLAQHQPLDVKVCTLLHRPERTAPELPISHVGFTLETDDFVFGYGLDYNQRFRELPFIATSG